MAQKVALSVIFVLSAAGCQGHPLWTSGRHLFGHGRDRNLL